MAQKILINKNPLNVINEISARHCIKRFMLVCDTAFELLDTFDEYCKIENIAVKFNSFSSNPLYDEVCRGVKLFKSERCDGIIAIGGGSTIDTAKCIKAFSKMSDNELYFLQKFPENDTRLLLYPRLPEREVNQQDMRLFTTRAKSSRLQIIP